jgi:Co/Zn/Cd efflux system component
MNDSAQPHKYHHRKGHDAGDMIIICLSDGPKRMDQIERYFIELPRRFGVFMELVDQESLQGGEFAQSLLVDLEKLISRGCVVRKGSEFALTTLGQQEASRRLEGLNHFKFIVNNFLQPQVVSKVSLAVHFLLAILKLPAGWLSGSIGLTNDALDTLLDGVCSLLVLLGLRYERERLVNAVLVVIMLLTGSYTFYEAVQRFFIPHQPQVNSFVFFCAIFSAVLCAALGFYQRYVGLRSAHLALITQSVDSRNHVIVALGVTAGLVAAQLRFPLLDTLVGLAVASLILKSAIELLIETVKTLKGEETDFTRFRPAILDRYDRFRKDQLRDWLLYLLGKEGNLSRHELHERARQTLDFTANPALRGLGLSQQVDVYDQVELSIQQLLEKGWITAGEHLSVSSLGRERLKKMKKPRYEYH